VKSYSIADVVQRDSTHATVSASITTDRPTPAAANFPVVKEDGKWKVCLTARPTSPGFPSTAPSASGTPSFPVGLPSITVPSVSVPSINVPSINLPSLPSGFSNPCGFATTAHTAAITYVGLAEIGQTDFAQGCVYKNSVAKSVTTSLKTSGSGMYSPGAEAGSKTEFTSIDGSSTIEVTATKESDGKFYITKVEKR
jgi:hypothetical protein